MRIPTLIASIPIALLAACSDGGDPSLLGGDVVGNWRAERISAWMTPPAPVEDRFTYRFADDGTMMTGWTSDPGSWSAATYRVEGGDLEITATGFDGVHVSVSPYRAAADRLLLAVLVPDGETTAFIGTWTGTFARDGVERTATLSIRGDGTATVAQVHPAVPAETYEAEWQAADDDIAITGVDGGPKLDLSLVDGVLGHAFERIP